MEDPRLTVIDGRLGEVDRIIAVMSSKGGVGKTLVSSTLSLILSKHGRKVGLLDLDFHNPSCHIVLGAERATPPEDKGVVPPEVHGVRFMSLWFYVGDSPLPLRGREVTDALIELLAVTIWGSLDYLIVDMPPGMGEQTLDLIRLLKRREALVVSTPSILSLASVRRLLLLLLELRVPIVGLVGNMIRGESDLGRICGELNIRYLGDLPYDRSVEENLGDPLRLLGTEFAASLGEIAKNFI